MDTIQTTEQERWLSEALGLAEGQDPFPWQSAVLREFPCPGTRRYVVDVPTGLGKTSIMAIWLVARALKRDLPRRLIYVVDRRTVVDQATEVAQSLRDLVSANQDVKDALGLTGELPVSTLRGKFLDNREWLEDPSLPAIIIGTVDMIGSRLLFEGYRTSRKMRPYHAGLIGVDSLLVLDEAHLVPPFERLLETVVSEARRLGGADAALPIPSFQLISLSATGRSRESDSTIKHFKLTPDDQRCEEVQKRLRAHKRARFHSLSGAELSAALAERALAIAGNDRRCIIYCTRRDTAQKTYDLLKANARRVQLLVGARRLYEREQAAGELEQLGFIAGKSRTADGPAFLVATSAGEVGIDLDADDMVSDLVPWERMVQRFGRVNRRGNTLASIEVFLASEVEPGSSSEDVDAATERARERERLYKAPFDLLPSSDEGIDVSPQALLTLKEQPEARDTINRASTPAPLHPELTRANLEAWSMTSLLHHTGRPKIEPWLRGWVPDEPPECAVAWRKFLPFPVKGRPYDKEIEQFFEAAPIQDVEVLQTACFKVAEWLVTRAAALKKERKDGTTLAAIIVDGQGRVSCVSIDQLCEKETQRKKTRDFVADALNGGTLVVADFIAGLNEGGLLAQTATEPPVTLDGGSAMPQPAFRVRAENVQMDASEEDVEPDAPDTGGGSGGRESFRLVLDRTKDGDASKYLVVEQLAPDAGSENGRSIGRAQSLSKHQEWTELRARRIAATLTPGYEDVISLAARLHDEGKRARRWQLAFKAPNDDVYAKTTGPLNSTILQGYRHEFGSLKYALEHQDVKALSDDNRDLLLHLIAAHHGFARPDITAEGCEDAPPSALRARRREVVERFFRLQHRFGPWGLAWLESLLRAADQEASRANDDQEDLVK